MTVDKAYLGAVSIKVDVPDIQFRNREMLRDFRRYMRGVHTQAVEEGRGILSRVLTDRKIFDTGKLLRSVASRLFRKSEDIFSGSVHFNQPGKEYAYFVEYGRGPSTQVNEKGYPMLPPKDVITRWAGRHGITSKKHIFNIRRHIAEHGVKGKFFMEQANKEIQENYSRIVDVAVEKYKRNIR